MSDFSNVLSANETQDDVDEFAGQSAAAFAAAVAGSVVIFAVQAAIFMIVKDRLSRI